MEILCKESEKIDEGIHYGIITKVVERITPQGWSYIDVFIKPDNVELELKWGAANKLTPITKLGKLLAQFVLLESEKMYDPEKILVNQRVKINIAELPNTEGKKYLEVVSITKLKA